MLTIPNEIGQLGKNVKLPHPIVAPKNHKYESEMWMRKNIKRYVADSANVFGDPVLIRFRDDVGYGICLEVSGRNVFAGFNGSLYQLFLFNGEKIIDVKSQSMLLGLDPVGDARVKVMNAEIDHACISIVASGITLHPPEDKVKTKTSK